MGDDAPPPAHLGVVLALSPASESTGPQLASVLRKLADDAERGEVVGFAIATELTGGRIATLHDFNDVHRMLGAVERLRHRLLTGT